MACTLPIVVLIIWKPAKPIVQPLEGWLLGRVGYYYDHVLVALGFSLALVSIPLPPCEILYDFKPYLVAFSILYDEYDN